MLGDVVFRVYGLHEGREKDMFFGAFRSREEAEARVNDLLSRKMHGQSWSQQYHDRGFIIREVAVESSFEIPDRPSPRDKYAVQCRAKPNRPGTWDSTLVEVHRRSTNGLRRICEYERNYSMLQTFEPFRQGGRDFALVSHDYTKTSVLDLQSGELVAEDVAGPNCEGGFCPVGFYVPDWWDVHDGSVIPGSEYWDEDHEWPTGNFGFVWGCYWGDDSSWKVQYLDLSKLDQGLLTRDDRFGYVELATSGYLSPCFSSEASSPSTKPPSFVQVSRTAGKTRVVFAVEMSFGIESGIPDDWHRSRTSNLE